MFSSFDKAITVNFFCKYPCLGTLIDAGDNTVWAWQGESEILLQAVKVSSNSPSSVLGSSGKTYTHIHQNVLSLISLSLVLRIRLFPNMFLCCS